MGGPSKSNESSHSNSKHVSGRTYQKSHLGTAGTSGQNSTKSHASSSNSRHRDRKDSERSKDTASHRQNERPSREHNGSSSKDRHSNSRHPDKGKDKEKEKERRVRHVEWKVTLAPMNARDLARDDDFISHMLVECLGSVEPLSVHKMDASRKLPTWNPEDILEIVQKVCLVQPTSDEAPSRESQLTNRFHILQYVSYSLFFWFSSWLCLL